MIRGLVRRRGVACVAMVLVCCAVVRAQPAGAALTLAERAAALAGVPPVPEPSCAECGGRNNRHSSNCPYNPSNWGGGGGGGSYGGGQTADPDITHVPIITAPVGMIGGVFMGGAWYFNEMAGKYRRMGFLKSYHKFMTIDTKDPLFDRPWNFGAHIGGAPWLAVFAATWPVRQGVIGTVKWATKPRPPKPPDPRIRVFESIAKTYAQLRDGTAVELAKVSADLRAAESQRSIVIEGCINDYAELRALREKEGEAAARARAEKMLNAWSKSRAERRKLYASVSAQVRGREKICQDAIDAVSEGSFGAELYLARKAELLKGRINSIMTPTGARDSFVRKLKVTNLLARTQSLLGVGGDLKDMHDSWQEARGEGAEFSDWWGTQGTTERLLRLNLKLLPALSKKAATGLTTASAESLMNGSYALTAAVAYHGQLESDRDLLNRLQTASVFHDAAADVWDRANAAVDAAQLRERAIRNRMETYERLKKENESHAASLRR